VTLAALASAVDQLVAADPTTLGHGEVLIDLRRQLDRLEAVAARAAAAFDASREWEEAGARSAASWLARQTRMPFRQAKRQVRLGRSLRHLPVCETAWLSGGIGADHVGLLASVRRATTEKQLAEDEEMLVDHALKLSFGSFTKALRYWYLRADPDGADDEGAKGRDAREFHLSQSYQGMWFSTGTFDPLGGAAVAGELERLERQLFEADWAEARARLGRDPSVAELCRSAAQRRADALVEMAVRSRAAPAKSKRPEPLFTVLVGWETLRGMICELASGTVIAPGDLVRWLDVAWLERVVFDSRSRVLDVGVRQRLFKGATRRAVEVRDRQCYHEYCEEPADQCQVDHVIPYEAGGPTTQDNGRPACGYHNRARHKRPDP
jgi:hypothetical protein